MMMIAKQSCATGRRGCSEGRSGRGHHADEVIMLDDVIMLDEVIMLAEVASFLSPEATEGRRQVKARAAGPLQFLSERKIASARGPEGRRLVKTSAGLAAGAPDALRAQLRFCRSSKRAAAGEACADVAGGAPDALRALLPSCPSFRGAMAGEHERRRLEEPRTCSERSYSEAGALEGRWLVKMQPWRLWLLSLVVCCRRLGGSAAHA